MKRIKLLIIIIPFALAIFAIPIIATIMPDETISNDENRTLTSITDIILGKLNQEETVHFREAVSQKEYVAAVKILLTGIPPMEMGKITTSIGDFYFSEQFPYRDTLVKLYSKYLLASGKIDARDVYIMDGWIYPLAFDAQKSDIEAVGVALNRMANKYPDIEFYYQIMPHKKSMLYSLEDNKYLPYTQGERSRQLLKDLLKQGHINVVDTQEYFNNLSLEEKKKLYFKGDFHWNALGAYEGMKFLQDAMVAKGTISEDQKFSDDDFVFRTLDDKQYIGDLQVRFSGLIALDEVVPMIESIHKDDMTYYTIYNNIWKRETLIGAGLDKNPIKYVDVYTENLGYYGCINENAKTDKKVMVFKDSFQNPNTDMLSTIFRDVAIIDVRYIDWSFWFHHMVEKSQPDAIIFMYQEQNYSLLLKDYLLRSL